MSSAREFFTAEEQKLVTDAIASAELKTSGEIRVHIENYCLGSEVAAARRIFAKLGMHKTAEHNGVLIYIAAKSHKVAIVGDEGIHAKLGQQYWQNIIDKVISEFKAGHKAEALAECIGDCGRELGKFFPRQSDDRNELTDDISFS